MFLLSGMSSLRDSLFFIFNSCQLVTTKKKKKTKEESLQSSSSENIFIGI